MVKFADGGNSKKKLQHHSLPQWFTGHDTDVCTLRCCHSNNCSSSNRECLQDAARCIDFILHVRMALGSTYTQHGPVEGIVMFGTLVHWRLMTRLLHLVCFMAQNISLVCSVCLSAFGLLCLSVLYVHVIVLLYYPCGEITYI